MSELVELCKKLEAFETPRWAIESILDVEVTTRRILDPCSGLGVIAKTCQDRGLSAIALDIVEWGIHFPEQNDFFFPTVCDFFDFTDDLSHVTVVMNPPFSKACEFVDHAHRLGARKVICFQRQAWRESTGRRKWWENNPPARVWVCGARAPCWRFDLLGSEKAEKSSSPTSYAWYVWERGHKGAEVTSAIYPRAKR
jgi:hypothetical protein